jgi:hypothetical protein
MQIFIDESGTFSGFHTGSIGTVGALAVPHSKLSVLEDSYEKIRRRLPLQNGEVKGRALNEGQIAEIVSLLDQRDAIFEVTAIDLAMHTSQGVAAYKDALLRGMTERVPRFNDATRPVVQESLRALAATPPNLFLQTIALFETIHRIIQYVPFYIVQRRPDELGKFSWVVDGKDKTKVTSWELWWTNYALGALATKSKYHPSPSLEGADYSHFDKFRSFGNDGEEGIELSLLLKDLRFSSDIEYGLEWVDVLTNAVRRAMVGNLGIEGGGGITRTMIHRREHYIALVRLDGFSQLRHEPAYSSVIRHFWSGGKSMLTKKNMRLAEMQAL